MKQLVKIFAVLAALAVLGSVQAFASELIDSTVGDNFDVVNYQEGSPDRLGIRGIVVTATMDGSNPKFMFYNEVAKKREALVKYRYLLPRDRKFTIENSLGADYKVIVTDHPKVEGSSVAEVPPSGRRSLTPSDQFIQIQIIKGDLVLDSAIIELVAARRLEILTSIGTGATFAPREPESYRLQVDPSITSGTNTRITRADSKAFTANVSGQIYAPFDDEAFMGTIGHTIAKILTAGLFNREHHRLGLMAGIATNGGEEPTYQIGYMWSLDREAKMVISVGWMFRHRQELQFGLTEGAIFEGDIPVRKTWKSSPFIGISFNLGNSSQK